jgi:DNA relaxase NicK
MEDYERWERIMHGQGVETMRASFQGYDGVKCGAVFLGERDDGFCTYASGWQSDLWAYIVPIDRWRPSRLDLQVTGLFEVPPEAYAQTAAQAAVEHRRQYSRGRPHRITLTEGFGRGDTLMLGSRTSEKYGRLYDKHLESKGEYPPGAWRFEVETKAETAREAFTALRATDDREKLIASIVGTFFVDRGVHFPVNVQTERQALHLGTIERSDERSLRWLRQHVRPTVQRLLAAGRKSDILDALGLTCQ